MEYTFEKVSDGGYQVRLSGEFITYVEEKDSEIVDERLKEHGWNTREEYYNYLIGK